MKRQKRILNVVGARPNYMKIAPLMHEIGKRNSNWEQKLVHTGQHYDHRMSEVFFQELCLPEPDAYLGTGSGSHAEQYAKVLVAFERVLKVVRPDLVIVAGDVNSTLACALCAAQMRIPVAHVEAGLRSFDRSMPEETNRTLTDHLSHLLFTSEMSANRNLEQEGIPADKIRFVGNTMIDSLAAILPKTAEGHILDQLGLRGSVSESNQRCDGSRPYVLVTLHRPQNVDEFDSLAEILQGLEELANHVPVIFPVHPRTRRRIDENHLSPRSQRIRLLEPLGYVDFITLLRFAGLVITDSGGIQEESTYLSIPCLTVRPNTERPVTIEMGTNRLVERHGSTIRDSALGILGNGCQKRGVKPPLWDGHAAERIVTQLEKF